MYKEVTTLTADPPDGIKVFPNEEDLTDLQVTIEGPGECERAREGPLGFLLWCVWPWDKQDSASRVLKIKCGLFLRHALRLSSVTFQRPEDA